MSRGFCYSVIVLLVMTSCVGRPKGILSDKDMAKIVADLELTEAYSSTLPSRNARTARLEATEYVLQKHGLTREEFDSTMSWYGRNVDAYYDMCDIAQKEIQNRKRKISGAKTVEIKTTDLWPYQKHLYLSALSNSNAFEFSIPAEDLKRGQNLSLQFKLNNAASADALFGIEYDNGLKSYLSRIVNESKKYELNIQTDTSLTVKRIFGNFIFNDKKIPLWLDSISLTALPLDSAEYHKIHNLKSTR